MTPRERVCESLCLREREREQWLLYCSEKLDRVLY